MNRNLSSPPSASRLSRRRLLAASAAMSAGLAVGLPTFANAQTPTAREMPDDWEGLVDIGGRSLYMETSGSGGPTVVLVTGSRSSARYWTDDLLHPDAPRKMVMAGDSGFTHVVAYDRPGTYAEIKGEIVPSRSDPIAQPRTATDAVAELHALLQAAGVPGPYVLAGHSIGGFIARLYASTYPEEVVGMILVDAYSELLEDILTPARYAALVRLNQDGGVDTVLPIPGYGDAETFGFGAGNEAMRKAAAASPLRLMPLAVLAHGIPFPLPASVQGFTSAELEADLLAVNKAQAALLPNSRFFLAAGSGHDIHQDQPELVIEAIRQVVEGVRNPDTWYSLSS